MIQTNQKINELILKHYIPIKIDLGDVFYTIEETDKKFYYEPCKVCEGKGKLTVNNITFDCPCCDKYRSPFSVARYKVTKWRVFMVSQSLSNGYWKKGSLNELQIYLYTMYDRGYNRHREIKLNEYNFINCRNVEVEDLYKVIQSPYGRLSNYVFDCYSHACNVADELNKNEEQKVIQHNKEYGTNYELPPIPKYDTRSN